MDEVGRCLRGPQTSLLPLFVSISVPYPNIWIVFRYSIYYLIFWDRIYPSKNVILTWEKWSLPKFTFSARMVAAVIAYVQMWKVDVWILRLRFCIPQSLPCWEVIIISHVRAMMLSAWGLEIISGKQEGGEFYILFIYWPHHMACGVLVPNQGLKQGPLALKAPRPNHRTATEFLSFIF